MKPELINLLHRLKAHPKLDGFQCLVTFPGGTSNAVYRNGVYSFESLEALERFAYPEPGVAQASSLATDDLLTNATAFVELLKKEPSTPHPVHPVQNQHP